MSGKFYPISLSQLLRLIFDEYKKEGTIFGLPQELFFNPSHEKRMVTEIFGQKIDTPVGVAAGPHTQMAQNIIGAWLMGARYIELKTVQTLDELEVPKPCIDMQDEGYNCEWSQELRIKESFDEYLKAWIMIHILNHTFGWGEDPGVIFNMSVGYNLQGIMNDNVQWFFAKMTGCRPELDEKIREIREIYPAAAELKIPAVLSSNITLSTMHGCPANEIEEIARYLLEEKKLHTFVKLNPTLLGPEELRRIVNEKLGFRTVVPDVAFEHDLKYNDAVRIIKSLRSVAAVHGLVFGLKLTNTLESVNNKEKFGNDVEMMYMSGRALHPVSVNVARKLQNEFGGELLLSFSSGADSFNITKLLACGFKTVTVCSDLLKPGGYMRLSQYFASLTHTLDITGSSAIDGLIAGTPGTTSVMEASLDNLNRYASEVTDSDIYKRRWLRTPDIKSSRELRNFDCITAPCRDTCATNQDIPDYMYFTAGSRFDSAAEVILRTNPFPSTTGMVCDHLCQGRCTRINYDDPLHIREIKRFISEQEEPRLQRAEPNGIRVAVIGAGPSGLSCAFYLALAGFSVDLFESRTKAGGMVQFAIPGFRLTDEAIEKDIRRITDLGVTIHYDSRIGADMFAKLRREYSSVYIGAGAQLSVPLDIPGSDLTGVIEPLDFLFRARKAEETGTGRNVVIIGGGNTAMDAARTALRLVGSDGKVTVVYRRTINEMPADQGEIAAVMNEGVEIKELIAPEVIRGENGRVKTLVCSRMELTGRDASGRPRPVKIEGSEFEIACDTIIPAIGQKSDIDFATLEELSSPQGSYMTGIEGVFIGGDAKRGASTAINAIGDGRKAATEIMSRHNISFSLSMPEGRTTHTARELMIKRAERRWSEVKEETHAGTTPGFSLVSSTISSDEAVREADRCLYCDEICNICTTVCPNFANRYYTIEPFSIMLPRAAMTDDGTIDITDDRLFEIRQKYQVLNIGNFCNECGNCSTFCPTAGAPYKDKPKIFLDAAAFNKADEGYMLVRLKERVNLIYKQNNSITTLSEEKGRYLYENDFVSASFTGKEFRLESVKFLTPCVREARFERAAIMLALLHGAETIL